MSSETPQWTRSPGGETITIGPYTIKVYESVPSIEDELFSDPLYTGLVFCDDKDVLFPSRIDAVRRDLRSRSAAKRWALARVYEEGCRILAEARAALVGGEEA